MSDERYEKGYTISIWLPKEAPKDVVDRFRHRIAELTYGELLEDRGHWDPAIIESPWDLLQIDRDEHAYSPHIYLSTSCHHGNHNYCQTERGLFGLKTPACCKFCAAPCRCLCHAQTQDK